ncbi:MAG: hypothetical protein PWP65_1622 [Clostridia bacterium]|nr:hypothetical protein [Clostridia bacterium]
MNTAALILTVVMIAVVAYLIAAPLFRPAAAKSPAGGLPAAEGDVLEQEKGSAFTALAEIEFDYRMQKLSEEDYRALRQQYKSRAIKLLKVEK